MSELWRRQALLFFQALELSVGKKINVLDYAVGFSLQVTLSITIVIRLKAIMICYIVCVPSMGIFTLQQCKLLI
jgi:hypothetical protein